MSNAEGVVGAACGGGGREGPGQSSLQLAAGGGEEALGSNWSFVSLLSLRHV